MNTKTKLEYKKDKKDTKDTKDTISNQKNQLDKLKDEIPLIDDGIEESNDKNDKNDKLDSIVSQCLNDNESVDRSINQNSTNQITDNHSSIASTDVEHPNEQTKKDEVDPVQNDQSQMVNNLEKLKLNEECFGSNASSAQINGQITDLNQLDSVELESSLNPDEQEEKERLIQQLLELRNTLDDLSNRVSSVREMSFKLTNENNVLNQYVENLMAASSVFQSTATTNAANMKRRQRK